MVHIKPLGSVEPRGFILLGRVVVIIPVLTQVLFLRGDWYNERLTLENLRNEENF